MKNVFLSLALAAFLLVGFNSASYAFTTVSAGYSSVINDDDPPKAVKAEAKDAKTAECKDKAKSTECKDAKAKDGKSCCPTAKSGCAKSCAGSTSCSKDKKPEKK